MNFFNNILERIATKVLSVMRTLEYRRRMRLLINKGLTIGKNVTIEPHAIIDPNYPYLISIGDNCSITRGVHILAHDATPFKFTGHTRIGKVEIKENCFISRNAIILPGVTVGPNVLVAAGSVVNKDIPPNSCVAGVPARFYAKFDEMIEKHEAQIKERSVFMYEDLYFNLNDDLKERVRNSVEDGPSYSKGYRGKYPYTHP